MSYVPLNIKTDSSFLSSLIRVDSLIERALELNLKSLTITDDNLSMAIYFYKACLKASIKPIIGLEVRVCDKALVLYCQNYDGYLNLVKICTLKSEKELCVSDLSLYSDNVICIMPYESRELYKELIKVYKYLFIGYSSLEQKAKIKSSNTVFMNEILVLNKDDEVYLKYLYAIKNGVLVKNLDFDKKDVYLSICEEENNSKINDLCNLEIKFHNDLLPVYSDELSSFDELKKQCMDGVRKHFDSFVPKKYVERLKYELSVIKKMGFCDYFLIVADYVNYAKSKGILVGPGRGSAAGSLVAYLLGITTIDPLKYNLLFERFLNPSRVTMPDIDIDFEDERRGEVIKYCIEKYGIKKVSLILTFSTLKSRAAIRDTARVLDVDSHKVDVLCSYIDSRKSLKDNLKDNKVSSFLSFNSELKRLYKIALKFEGLKRQSGIHAAGVIMSKCDLDLVIPLSIHDGVYVTGYPASFLEELGLLKMDFLGLRTLSIINEILKDINIGFDDIKENDRDALRIFEKADTLGIFQFESSGMRSFLAKFKPNSFEDVSSALALFRPGPLKNIDSYIRRKEGREKIDYIHVSLEGILKPTYGIIVYQEQIMQIVSVMAGYSMASADNLRRAISKKKENVLRDLRDDFISSSVKRGYSKEVSNKVYDLILRFADYGFNRSHSVAYAMISYRMAYLKAHYPLSFFKTFLNSSINSVDKTKMYIYECRKKNISVLNPDINLSMDKYIIYNNSIVYPLSNIKNVSLNVVFKILSEREKSSFKDIFDFVIRCGSVLNEKILESLILAGCFDSFSINRKTLINNLEIIINYAEIGEYLDDSLKPTFDVLDEYSDEEIVLGELKVFGFYLTNHPVTKYKSIYSCVDLNVLENYFDKNVKVIIKVSSLRVITTKKGDEMMFMSGEDEFLELEFVMFPKVYKKYDFVSENDILYVFGHVEKRFDKLQIVVTNLKKLN